MMVANLKPGKLRPLLKHPFLLAVKLWAFAHLLVNGDLASVVLFGSFLGLGGGKPRCRGAPPGSAARGGADKQ